MITALLILGYVVLSVVVTSLALRFWPGEFEESNRYGDFMPNSVNPVTVTAVLAGWPIILLVLIPIGAWLGLFWTVKMLAGRRDA